MTKEMKAEIIDLWDNSDPFEDVDTSIQRIAEYMNLTYRDVLYVVTLGGESNDELFIV